MPATCLDRNSIYPYLALYVETVLGEGKAMYDSAVGSARKTVFIIGAGASKEAGLHIKSELKTRIAKALDIWFEILDQMVSGDRRIFEALRARVTNESDPKSLLGSLQ